MSRLSKATSLRTTGHGNWCHFKVLLALAVFGMALFSSPIPAIAGDKHMHHDMMPDDAKATDHSVHATHPDMFGAEDVPAAPADTSGVGVDEKLGQVIDGEIRFLDENATPVIFDDFIDRPTLILPVFYHCPKTCSLLLSNLAHALNDVTFTPGKSFRVLAFSFDDEETPEDAKKAKKNYLGILKKDFPTSEWRFLTGTSENIDRLTDDMGFNFKKLDSHNFVHPNVLLCLAADRKIIRYLYGPDFLPFDISMAIAEAEKGTPGISIKKIVSLCFAYDPKGQKYVFKTFRITGIIIISLLVVFVIFLVRKKDET